MKHIHKLKKHKYKSGNTVFHCILPDCYFKVETALALGKEAICNICGESFIMSEYSIRLTRPHCANCGRREVKTNDGKKFYVNKRTKAIMTDVAVEEASDLRSRLDSITNHKDEDI